MTNNTTTILGADQRYMIIRYCSSFIHRSALLRIMLAGVRASD